MTIRQLTLLRIVLLALIGACVLAQVVVIPILATEYIVLYPELESSGVIYAVASVLAIVGVEYSLYCTFRLTKLIDQERIFARGSVRWVSRIVLAACFSSVVSAMIFAHMAFVALIGGPLAFFLFVLTIFVGAGSILVLLVLRKLLVAATQDRVELEGVI